MKTIEKTSCHTCGEISAQVRWDDRYSGYRGFCIICKGNWPES